MKKFLAIPVLLSFCYFLTSFTPGDNPVKSKKEDIRCGPAFHFYNSSGNIVTRITIQGPSPIFTYTIDNPVFPYLFHETVPNGTYTFIVRFASGETNNGSIIATETPSGSRITCETYEPPYTVPLVFATGCYIYNIVINANPAGCD